MKIDGRIIADQILVKLSDEVARLKEKGVTPTLAVILVGDNPASLSYIKQKQKAAETIGAKVVLDHQPATISPKLLKSLIEKYNNDSSIHGIIIQRPVPEELGNVTAILESINPQKDVDGFVPGSPFQVPVAAAVLTILQNIYFLMSHSREGGNPSITKKWIPDQVGDDNKKEFESWLKRQCVTVIGRGETAGKPIADLFSHQGCTISVVHSQTQHPEEVIKKTLIVISCVGKEKTVTKEMLQKDAILISVGIWRDSEGKLHGDYDEEEIKDLAAYYTPTPGGVGPVNVACLMQNLVTAAAH